MYIYISMYIYIHIHIYQGRAHIATGSAASDCPRRAMWNIAAYHSRLRDLLTRRAFTEHRRVRPIHPVVFGSSQCNATTAVIAFPFSVLVLFSRAG